MLVSSIKSKHPRASVISTDYVMTIVLASYISYPVSLFTEGIGDYRQRSVIKIMLNLLNVVANGSQL